MDKAKAFPIKDTTRSAYGSISNPSLYLRPASPTTPFEFPFQFSNNPPTPTFFADEPGLPRLPMDGVQRVVGLPQVFGLHGNISTFARVNRSAIPTFPHDDGTHPSIVDGGTNICVTGVLDLLVDVETIPPLPISVATKSSQTILDHCCTKQGFLPLTLDNGSIYYQSCYYCKNATETIISPDAILQSSAILAHWHQVGHCDDSPGSIPFTSNSGLFSISLSLKKHDGLYYCPTDVFTIAPDKFYPEIPRINRVTLTKAPILLYVKRGRRYQPVAHSKLTESETWMLRLGSPGEDQLDLLPGNATGIPTRFQYHPFRFLDWKEEARIQKQAAQRTSDRTTEPRR